MIADDKAGAKIEEYLPRTLVIVQEPPSAVRVAAERLRPASAQGAVDRVSRVKNLTQVGVFELGC